jgi:predicted dehydrogenase
MILDGTFAQEILSNLKETVTMNAQHSNRPNVPEPSSSRREFLKHSGGALAGVSLASSLAARSYAGEDHTIKVALVGCGGRGTGAAKNALSTEGPTKLWALADVFEHKTKSTLKNLATEFGSQLEVTPERQFVGMDAYCKAIDALDPGDVVLLATPPAFRPIHVEYAVEKGVHVFMEKSFAVDGPGIRRILRAGAAAREKNLKIAGGLMSRHYRPLQEAVQQLHDGIAGDIITCWAYREHGPAGFVPRSDGINELGHQIRNYSCYTWLNGSFILDWLIHNLDVCCWVKNAWPVSAQGQGGRQMRQDQDQLFDHYAVEYKFADGTRLFAQGRHMVGCWGFFGDVIHGTKGSAVLGEGIRNPKIYRGHQQTSENLIWEYQGPECHQYQTEHDVLFNAIRQDRPHNESERCAKAAMTGILGRMAAESGKLITWDEAFASNLELAPGLDSLTWEGEPPVKPDAEGNYPIAKPGFTKVI